MKLSHTLPFIGPELRARFDNLLTPLIEFVEIFPNNELITDHLRTQPKEFGQAHPHTIRSVGM